MASAPSERSPSKPFPIVGIGASAGGLEAFTSFLKALPADTGMAFVLVQHMDPTHVSLLNQLLKKDTSMPVFQVKNGMAVKPNCVYVIPPNTNMTIEKGKLHLVARPSGGIRHTPIDSFLDALAEDQRNLAVGVVLSGIGSDGTKGLQAIKAQGGISFAQDAGSAKYPGMPQSAVATGCVDLVLPPGKIAQELARMRRHPYLEIAQQPETAELPPGEDGHLRKIFRLMRSTMGVDFTYYKQGTIRRRISRRMLVRRCETLADYAKHVERHPDELQALFQDVLIHVTEFFREPEVFESLKRTVFPRITPHLAPGESVRIWVPGCSSGEEVYSIAIALHEYLGERAPQTGIQIFGTDIYDTNIQKARVATYGEASTHGLSQERLRRYFVKMEGGYQVAKSIRETCIFARHDLTKDPPFSRIDLISCRNVLIYLTPALQKRVLEFFHYALKPAGFLILGKSEGTSAAANLFSLEDRKANVYFKIPALGPAMPEFPAATHEKVAAAFPLWPRQGSPFDLRKEAERIVVERYAPPGLIVDADLRVINFQGDTSPFLRPASGEASFDLLKLVRPELILETRSAIQQAKEQGSPAHRNGIPFKRNDQVFRTDLEVVPIPGRLPKGADFLVLFQNTHSEAPEKGRPFPGRKSGRKAEASETERLKQQLASMQDNMRSLMEDQEAAAEELQAANEEVLSSNEELQSTNEELQTAKEELQSSNEELTTLNEELQNRNLELAQTASDLNSLLNAIEIPIVILGNDRRIRRFTTVGEQLLNLIPSDVGRPISQIRSNLDNADLDQMAAEILERRVSVEREVRDPKGHWYALRMRPYQAADGRIEGILAVLLDIHDIKQYSTAIVDTMRGCLLVLDSHFQVLVASPGFYKTFQVKREETEGKLLSELGNRQWNILELRELLEKILPDKKEVVDFEVQHEFPEIGNKIMLLSARQLQQSETGSPKILLVIEDITERRLWEQQLQASESRVRALLESAAHAILAVDSRGRIALVNTTTEQMFGYTRTDLLGEPLEMLLPKQLQDPHRKHRAEYFAHPRNRPMGIGLELSARRKDGTEFPIEVSLSYLESSNGTIAVAFVSDITTRKAAEQSAQRLAAIVESSNDAIFSKTLEGKITSWNHGAERMYGYSAEEFIGRSVSQLIPSDHPNELAQILKRIKGGEQILGYETERLSKDGRRITVSLTISPIRNSKDEIVAASVIARDITRRKQGLETLRRLSKVFTEATDSFVILDRDGRIRDLNKETERAYGWGRDELLGQPLQTMVAPERHGLCSARITRCLEGEAIRNAEGVRVNKAGERIPILLTLSPLTDEKGDVTGVAILAKDVSELRRAEDELKQNQEELRKLSARLMTTAEEEGKRIARELHDSFGPRLASINLKVSEVANQLSSRPDLVSELEAVGKEISEVAKATHDLSHSLHPAAVSQLGVAAALETECATFSDLYGTTVNFSSEAVPELFPEPVALCLYRVVQESLQNIQKHAQAKKAAVTLKGEGQEIVMVIQDFGKGFDPDAARRGLGLVSMEERVRQVNGSLSVNSRTGEGTQVEVRIPFGGT